VRLTLVKRHVDALSDPDDLVLGLAPDFPDAGLLHAVVVAISVLADLIAGFVQLLGLDVLEPLLHGLLSSHDRLATLSTSFQVRAGSVRKSFRSAYSMQTCWPLPSSLAS
jgi:hypothetical protein